VFQEEKSIFWEVIVSVILSTNVYMYVCLIPNGFRDRVGRSRTNCCHGNATIPSLFIVGVDVTGSNTKVFSVAMEIQQWFPFALLLSYKVFRTFCREVIPLC
jgi:hypothetical protein